MKCNNCKLVEMRVIRKDENATVYQCPKCKQEIKK